LKFDRLLRRARQLGFDAVATGHHARVRSEDGCVRLLRGADPAKDQSYVLYVLGQDQLSRCLFPVGEMTKDDVRTHATALGLRTAGKPDSVEVCFVTASGGREALLRERVGLRPGRVVDTSGALVGAVDATELVTVGQRRGLGAGGGRRLYALSVDPAAGTVVAGGLDDLLTGSVQLRDLSWVHQAADGPVLVQCSAHAAPVSAVYDAATSTVHFTDTHRRIAPGQSVVLYHGDEVLGGGIAA
jgi:tRNA-specific 2-thiouridylase